MKTPRYFLGYLAILAILFLIVFFWLRAVRASQLASHKITNSINGKIISQFWTTNPVHVQYVYTGQYALTSNGWRAVQTPVTNYYWRIWNIWK